ncbi:cation efflux family-domain-containing protein [Gilbertella persicaria]|uniref:cation efflux family-domain-containing protein n=1 Tax=Gilbertella persicaria TaxID=101096 RepID=UPI00221FFB3D|nr:cation efflux family-domain-containing protein [Gilbertella persicaria]KAI8090071.1 cation efflux family-domain-containing protein [Gilbertella persicaria]
MSPEYDDTSSSARQLQRRASLVAAVNEVLPPPVHFESLRVSDDQLKTYTNKHVKKFYQHQNDMISKFTQVDRVIDSIKRGEIPLSQSAYGSIPRDEEHGLLQDETGAPKPMDVSAAQPLLSRSSSPDLDTKKSPMWIIHLAINLSFFANVALFLTKIILAWYSGSMALLASAFESFLDIVSNAIIFFTVRIIRQKDYYTYPVGKSRMEPLGIIVFAVVITTSFSQVLISSIEKLTSGEATEQIDLSMQALIILGVNVAVKAVLWVWCASVKGSSSVEALAYDHENDVVFTISSTLFPVVGNYMEWGWLDPLGAILLSIYIIYEWMGVLLENIRRLTGQAASADDLKQLTYMAYRFSKKIQAVDTVRAYYIGDRLLVEIDIILPPDCPLREAHDVGEALQDALELLENVERAFVHLDYSAEHDIEHRRVVDDVGFNP